MIRSLAAKELPHLIICTFTICCFVVRTYVQSFMSFITAPRAPIAFLGELVFLKKNTTINTNLKLTHTYTSRNLRTSSVYYVDHK